MPGKLRGRMLIWPNEIESGPGSGEMSVPPAAARYIIVLPSEAYVLEVGASTNIASTITFDQRRVAHGQRLYIPP